MVYFRFMHMHLKSLMQYRASTIMMTLSRFILSFGYFFGVMLLFDRFGGITGWDLSDVALCWSVSHMAFSLAEFFTYGFDVFQRTIRSGDFDRLLLRPRGTVLQVFCSAMGFNHIGRLVQSAVVLGIAINMAGSWNVVQSFIVFLMVISGFCVFTGLYILGASVCFWTIQGLEFINIFTDGGKEVASYPITIYQKWFVKLFTYIIPFACFNYLPLLYLTGRTSNTAYLLAPLAGILFIVPCLFVWRAGVRRYASTGS